MVEWGFDANEKQKNNNQVEHLKTETVYLLQVIWTLDTFQTIPHWHFISRRLHQQNLINWEFFFLIYLIFMSEISKEEVVLHSRVENHLKDSKCVVVVVFLLFVSHCCFDTRNWTRMLFRIIKCKALEEIILVNDFLRFSTDELSLFIWCMCVYLLSIAIMFYVCAVCLWIAFIEIEWNCRHCVTLTQTKE